jgi:hypothetical protein
MRKLGRTQTIRNPPTSVVWPNRLPDLSHFDGYVIDEEVCEVLTQLGNNGVRIYHQALRATGVGIARRSPKLFWQPRRFSILSALSAG